MILFTDPTANALTLALFFSLGINALFFAIAATLKTDKVTDLSYSLTFFVLALFQLQKTQATVFSMLPALLVMLWALRLGSYLFYRILKIGHDDRFDKMRTQPLRFAGFWTLQALTVWIVMIPVVLFYAVHDHPVCPALHLAGLLVWMLGLTLETISDIQKFRFKSDPENRGRWIASGLWKYSRHPNFFGEALLWWGLFLYIAPVLNGWQWLAATGPLFLTLLLRFVSGVPILERKAEAKHGNNQQYRAYRDSTSLLIPWFPRKKP